jgi:hypothetical protein
VCIRGHTKFRTASYAQLSNDFRAATVREWWLVLLRLAGFWSGKSFALGMAGAGWCVITSCAAASSAFITRVVVFVHSKTPYFIFAGIVIGL